MTSALDAVNAAMDRTRTPPGVARAIMRSMWGSATGKGDEVKWSDLTDVQKWGVVCAIDPEARGPYGEIMEEF